MKVNVSVEATSQEMREFLGLPNVQVLQDDILQSMRDGLKRGSLSFETFNMFKPLLPTQFHSMDVMHKFWEAFSKQSTSPSKDNSEVIDTSESNGQ